MAAAQLNGAGGRRETWLTLAILIVLFAVSAVPSSAYRYRPRQDTTIKKVFRTMQKRGLNREALARQTAGYYEGLLDEAVNVTRMGGRSLLDWRFWLVERRERGRRREEHTQIRDDFLRFELRPNVNLPDIDERRRIVTNSAGMMDKDYPQTPAPQSWRLALIGDSISQGIGAEFGTSYEARLEEHLNAQFADGPFNQYEILNFSVSGYQLSQLVDVAHEKVGAFAPHVFMLALTERSLFTVWADHIAGLVRSGIDVKYDFLKTLVREAGLTPNMTPPLINAKLARYREGVIRWAVSEVRAEATRSGARFIVLLVPSADDPENQVEQFEPTRRLLDEMGVPTVDLLETFAHLDDLGPVRVSAANRHPNNEGHRLLFDALVAQIETDSSLRGVFTGMAVPNSLSGTETGTR